MEKLDFITNTEGSHQGILKGDHLVGYVEKKLQIRRMFVNGKIHTLKYFFICLFTQNVPSIVLFYLALVSPFVCRIWELL